ncbi:SubName: Full=Uncharacterized protein {ECO:0000313/EMBL:CCA70620.1} [Serendipita indica DSM 11827]|nr:SubName: Full=Uncharacterized protein {ECO:0000313/EMBL:CCA70620.1} [Serendipita indica DSM 11827]
MSSSLDESGPSAVEYSYESGSVAASHAQYYVDYAQHAVHHAPMAQPPPPAHQQPQIQLLDDPHQSHSGPGSLYRRASFPFVHHDHPMAHYPKYPPVPPLPQEHPVAGSHHALHVQDAHPYEYDDGVKLEHATGMIVPTQVPPTAAHHPQGFYRPSSSSSSVSSVSATPSYLTPAMSNIPVMHTDDAASKETQYLRRKCFNCGTTEPPSWRRSTLNPGKIVCNKCGLYERTHNKPRPHQFGLRPGNKARKQSLPTYTRVSPSSSPKRHGLSVKKEPLDYGQAMRRGSIASINSGSGTSDWDDHSGYSTASSAYPSSLGMAPPPPQPPTQPSYHVPNHHGHHPYNNALSMHTSRGTSSAIRLPQAPPMKIPTKAAGSPSPVSGPVVTSSTTAGSGSHVSSPEGLVPPAPQGHSPTYGTPSSASSSSARLSAVYGGNLRGPPPPASAAAAAQMMPSQDYYARRGSTSQIPHHHVNQYQQEIMRRGSVGAIGMHSPTSYHAVGLQHRVPPIPVWAQHQSGSGSPSSTVGPMIPASIAEMSPLPTPTPPLMMPTGNASASSTPRREYVSGELTPSPPNHHLHPAYLPQPHSQSASPTNATPLGSVPQPELATLAV